MRHSDPFAHPEGALGAWAGRVMAKENAAAEARAAQWVAGHAPVLEIGCGPGIGLRLLGRSGVGIDLSRPMVRQASQRAPAAGVVQADAQAMPFPAATFHAAMAVHCLALLPARALHETRRVLAAEAPFVAVHRTVRDGGPQPIDLVDRLEGAGFAGVGWRPERRWSIVFGHA